MSLITEMQIHEAVAWTQSTTDRRGSKTYGDPVQIQCRWDRTTKVVTDVHGNEKVSHASIYTDVELVENTLLARGTLDAMIDASDPHACGALPIISVEEYDTIDGEETLFIYSL